MTGIKIQNVYESLKESNPSRLSRMRGREATYLDCARIFQYDENVEREQMIETTIRELISFHRRNGDFNLDVFGNRLSSDQYRIAYESTLSNLPEGANVMDWGCGNGHFSYFLARAGFRVTGFSFLGYPLLMKESGLGFDFVPGSQSDPRRLPFHDEEFDAVVSMGVLEHVRETGGDERSSVSEIRRILKPGGVFLCAHFPNRLSWIEFLTRKFLPSRFRHRYRFTRRNIGELWSSTGFTIRRISRYGWLPRNVVGGSRSAFMDARLSLFLYDLLESIARVLLYPLHQNFLIVAVKNRGLIESASPDSGLTRTAAGERRAGKSVVK
ncbi:MAG: class I SAM-dependent methyltransferase [Ignavibacteria bacterium]|nr:MAG: class I SAM-dependent methyltransferase [Ignavibacteria bacterium]